MTDINPASDAPRCIVTGDPLTRENNSRAHVIPSALGGRYKPWDVLSRVGNTRLGDTVDKLLIDALSPLMTQLNASRDRGNNQPFEMEDASGTRYSVSFNEPVRPTRPVYRETEHDGETRVHIETRTHREMRTMLGRVKSTVTGFDVEEAMEHATVAHEWPEGGTLKLTLDVGPRRTFPGIFVAASVFAKAKGLDPHPKLQDYVDLFDIDDPASPPDTFYFYSDRPWATAPGEVTHKVVLVADPRRRQMLVLAELFNILEVAVLLPYDGDTPRIESYGVDVLTGAEVPVRVDADAVIARSWTATHDLGPSLWAIIEARTAHVTGIAQRRATDAMVKDQLDEAAKRMEGPITASSLTNMLRVPTDFTMQEIKRPGVAPKEAMLMAANFRAMVDGMTKHLPRTERAAFVRSGGELIRQVAAAASLVN